LKSVLSEGNLKILRERKPKCRNVSHVKVDFFYPQNSILHPVSRNP